MHTNDLLKVEEEIKVIAEAVEVVEVEVEELKKDNKK